MFKGICVAAAFAALTTGCITYAPSPATTVVPISRTTTVYFTDDHAAVIRAHYAGQTRGPGRGRGRHGGLPPGIAKNLARGKPLPPGIAMQHLPPDLVRRLPPVDRRFEYVVVAGKLLLVEVATQIVHDVLLEAVFG